MGKASYLEVVEKRYIRNNCGRPTKVLRHHRACESYRRFQVIQEDKLGFHVILKVHFQSCQ
jgi:hypothetical protein